MTHATAAGGSGCDLCVVVRCVTVLTPHREVTVICRSGDDSGIELGSIQCTPAPTRRARGVSGPRAGRERCGAPLWGGEDTLIKT